MSDEEIPEDKEANGEDYMGANDAATESETVRPLASTFELGTVIGDRYTAFIADLKTLNAKQIVQKNLLLGDCYAFGTDAHFDLLHRIASTYEINTRDVMIVGSAKLGFSIAPGKRYQVMADTSDVDIAIVSAELFDLVWKKVFDFWSTKYWHHYPSFCNYLFKGWIRPDKLPPRKSFPFSKEWWEFFEELRAMEEFGGLKLRAGLYRDMYFLESYQRHAVQLCQEALC